MPRECTICGKKSMLVNRRKKLRGKYNPTTKRRQKPNLQKALVPDEIRREQYREYAGQSVLMCSKCRKTMFKEAK